MIRQVQKSLVVLGLGCVLYGCDGLGVVFPGADCGGLLGLPCGLGQFCRFETGTCGAADETGVCTLTPELCTLEFRPVCGCDGITYSNECQAWSNGISVVSEGECDDSGNGEDFCGGIAAFPCDEGDYCQFEPGICGEGDQSGTCQPIPETCTEEFAPVCGCDDRTYSNACFAAAEGISVQHDGACETPG